MYFLDEFEKQVKVNGNSTALTDRDGERAVTYKELDAWSNKIGNKLLSIGVRKKDSVIIVLPRISEYIACEIAILKIGAVVVPLIPEYPRDRVEFIEKDCGAASLIREDFFLDIETFSDETANAFDMNADERGMIIYTSGSTGRPKGVVYTRSNLDSQIKRQIETVSDISPLVFGASATMSFCVTVTEYMRTLAMGGHVHIISDEVRSDAKKLSGYYINNQITTGFISPRILKSFECGSKYLRRVFTASEKVVNIYSPDIEIVNDYGQSETVGAIISFTIDKPYDNTPVGKPLKGIEVIVVSEDGKELLDGEEGEICFIGDLPCEYNNLQEQTARVFKKLPDGRVFIHSGDIGKKLPDGNLLFLNRNDWMIKIHGQRVEPGEIESAMNTVEGITGSVVKAFENVDGTMLLCGFYTGAESMERELIKKRLEAVLPKYMIPGVFVRMEAFPVNANGKLDRKAIERPDLSKLTAEYEKPVGEIEQAIADAMQELLNIKRVGRKDNFFELGGNSLNAVSLCAHCNIEGIAPQIVMIGQTPEKIAQLISENSFYKKPKITVSNKLKSTYPLSLSQKYQYGVCAGFGKTMDCIDMIYFFKLGEDIDIRRLQETVGDIIDKHPIYKCHIDIEKGQLSTDETPYKVEDIYLKAEDFGDYRKKIYTHIRDLSKEPLFDARLLHIDDGDDYLFMSLCHLVYDGKTLNNLLKEISALYNGEPAKDEQATIFDLIDNEQRIQSDKNLVEQANRIFALNYEGLKKHKLFESDRRYETAVTRRILEKESNSEIDDYLKVQNISVLTLFQAAMEITVKEMFKTEDFCYMNVHDGRGDELLDMSHGVFAKAVFMRSGVGRFEDFREYLRSIEEQYQRLVYYDVLDTFETVSRYPEIMSGITFNFRDMQGITVKLGAKPQFSEFLDEVNEAHKPFTDFDFIINRLPKGYGYMITLATTRVTESFAQEFIDCFNKTILGVIHGQ